MKTKVLLLMLLAIVAYGQTSYKIVIPDSNSISGYAIILDNPDTLTNEAQMKTNIVKLANKLLFGAEVQTLLLARISCQLTLIKPTLTNDAHELADANRSIKMIDKRLEKMANEN